MKRLLASLMSLLLVTAALLSCAGKPDPADQIQSESDTNALTSASTGVQTTGQTASSADPTEPPVPVIDPDASYLTADYSSVSGETVNRYPRLTNLPALYITLDEGRSIGDVPHSVYVPGSYTFVSDYVEDSYYELPMNIKGRGNYSWSFYQKPYTLKLDQKANFLGMGDAKKWILVTVSSDRTMLRNYMTQKFAKELGLPGTCDNEYVDVIVNGSYHGTYVLTEKIEFGEDRINVAKDQGILFEIEMVYRHSCEYCVVMYEDKHNRDTSVHLEIKDYKNEDMENWRAHEKLQKIKELQTYFDRIGKAMQTGDYATIEKYMDVGSFVNWYLLNEITRNYDSAFVTSCYCFIDENEILHMGPCWDYDTCYGAQFGESQGQHIQDAPWFGWLFNNCPEFVQKVKERWTELRTNGMIDKFLSDIDVTREYIAMSEKMEHTKYPESEVHSYGSYDEAIQFLKDWLDVRLKWMDSEFLLKK